MTRLRTGRKVGRTIYRQLGAEPSDDDPIVGLVDTPELAAEIVAAVNRPAPCDLGHPSFIGQTCALPQGHEGNHRTPTGVAWTDRPCYIPHPFRPDTRQPCLLPLGHPGQHNNGRSTW
jgi:hypothetical protein